jgi:cyanophycinase
MEPLERALLAGRPPRFVQLATAAAPEGPTSLARWHALGADAARRLGVEQVVVPVADREDADDPRNAALVAGAGLVYLSGGDPGHLVSSLRGSLVWAAIVAAWSEGAALAGCSAGAMALAASVAPVRRRSTTGPEGLGVVPGLEVLPHFDRFSSWQPDLARRRVAAAPAGLLVVGIDEETALVGGLPGDPTAWRGTPAGPGSRWRVTGRRSVWLLREDGQDEVPTGAEVVLGVPRGEQAPVGE